MPRNKISEALQEQVRQRSNGLCEYCHASEQWQADKEIGRHPPSEDQIQP